jgi:hypothetical protein
MPTAEQQQQKNKPVEPRFKIDHAASPMPETRQPERLAPRATSNRNGGRDHLGILGEIKSVHPGEIIGIGNHPARDARALAQGRLSLLLALEVAATGRAAADRNEAARIDPADERRKSALGRATHPRRTAQARN